MPRCSTACSTGSECSHSLGAFFLEASKRRLRSTQFWAAVDWLTQFGDDPDREIYPESWNGALVPAPFWGSYNTPGWTANGTNPYPTKAERAAKPFCESSDEWVQPDPIAAEAMLFFKGWLLLNMGVYARVSGDTAKWEREWTMSGIDD
eukprot:COSAG04_NODE_15209_length_539_cov_1.393182_2_plen_148_part_01